MVNVIYRVNAGGEEIAAIDGGLNWSADTEVNLSDFLVSEGSNETNGFNVVPDFVPDGGTVPASVPAAIFQTERWDEPGDDPIEWAFEVPEGDYEVRLYLGNGFGGTSDAGERIFDVEIEENLLESTDDIDLSQQFGHLVGGLISNTVTVDDGFLNLEFLHGAADNPLVNGIEILAIVPNTPPFASNDDFTTNEDTVINDNVLVNDNDPNEDPLTVLEVNGGADDVGQQITLSSGALLTLNEDGTFIYDPDSQFDALNDGETDSDSFSYTVGDGNGGTNTASVSITINGVGGGVENGLPEAVDDAFETDGDTVVNDNVLDNDNDPNEDLLTVLEVNGGADDVGQQITLSSGALLTLNEDGTFDYDPNGQFDDITSDETDSFIYTVDDGNNGTDTATVEITIQASDVLPIQPSEVAPFISFESLVTVANAQGFDIPYAPVEVGGLNLGQFFDNGFYLNQNPDVLAAVIDGSFTTPFEHFVQFGWLERRNASILFNEQEYLAQNEDVAAALEQGDFTSGFQHFVLHGHLEDRDPSSLFSQSDYLNNNPDVKEAVEQNIFGSAFEHYVEFGALEGRGPELSLYQEDVYLENNQDVKDAVLQGEFANGFEHFAQFGITENRQFSTLYSESAYLAANPDVDAAVSAGDFPSGVVHYALFGAAEGRPLA